MDTSGYLVFFVNGKRVCIQDVDPATTLADFLRRQIRLTGTKIGCEEGSCGSCTVMISKYNRETDTIRHRAITSCLTPICTLHGLAVTTIEGLGNLKSGLNPVQERIAKFHGTQCGFCTPGMVMSMYSLLKNNPQPTLQDIKNNLNGNVCRCTGYRPILDAFQSFSKDDSCSKGSGCCRERNVEQNDQEAASSLVDVKQFPPLDPTQELIFPPELKLPVKEEADVLGFEGGSISWFRPRKLEPALEILSANPDALIVSGCTATVKHFKNLRDKQVVIDLSDLQECKGHHIDDRNIVIGSGVTMTELVELCKKYAASEDNPHKGVSDFFLAIPKVLDSWHSQLKNSATLGGHIMLKKPIYDLLPLLVAGDCYINIAYKGGFRQCLINLDFFQNPTVIGPCEIVTSIVFPTTSTFQFIRTYKIADRKKQAFPQLSAAFAFEMPPENKLFIKKARLVFGGQITALVDTPKTQDFFIGREPSTALLDKAQSVLREELTTIGFSKLQIKWASGFLEKCIHILISQDTKECVDGKDGESGGQRIQSKQIFEICKEGEYTELSIVGEPFPHSTAEEHATGEAIYLDDIQPSVDELFMYPVFSTRSHATVTGKDLKEALSLPGVVGYVDSSDVPGGNWITSIYKEEEIFTSDTVNHCGQIICGIVADDPEIARKAASLVKIYYQDKIPVITTIKEAIASNSFFGEPKVVVRGDIETGFASSDRILEGELFIQGQKHMYLEPLSARVTPKERGELVVECGTQMPDTLQELLANIVDIPAHKISVRVKRVGGAFGGKEVRSFIPAFSSAIAAIKYQRPVRCVLARKDDTILNGGRHPVLLQYKVGFKNHGKILALRLKFFLNAGCTQETSDIVREYILLRSDAAYNFPAIHSEGWLCRTNLSSNSSCRGFGTPQIKWLIENIMDVVATALSMPSEKVKEINLYQEGDIAMCGTRLKSCNLTRCWQECKKLAQYEQRLEEVAAFNKCSPMKKRGLSMTPCMFGIGISFKPLHQAGALLNVYKDGSVLVSHGGVEMGQGIHTKMKQIASESLGIDYDKVLVTETSTNLVPNATFSAASVTTDLSGAAVQQACQTLLDRLKPFMEAKPDGKWETWIKEAYLNRVSLSVAGFAKVGDLGKGPAYIYHTYGVGCCEVELDCLSGEHQLIRTDIVMDVGRSINPGIDVGQIEGGFIQGYGYYMMENPMYSDQGKLLSSTMNTYHVPLCSDIPGQFNVALLKNSTNDKAIFSSKGIGEPPFVLAVAAHSALRMAIRERRVEKGLGGDFILDSPAIPSNVVKCLMQK